ncbi:MAG: hypothetical protein IIC58_13670 [Proteobacteria bacterium]|nr:hypothetical protein [Pseudomonadota bacterium]
MSDYEPVGSQDREDERARLKLDYNYQADGTWTIIAEFLYTNNRPTDPVYEYDKYTVVVGVNALF